jgi:peptidoglycan/LPS O-acetylase OafA/YrhL
MQVKREIRSLTGLRGVAAVYVVIFHYVPGVGMSNPLTTLLAHGYLAVDLFFVLSGFVMALNYGHLFETRISLLAYRTFLGRRIARIYPLYFAGTLAGFGLVEAALIEPLHSGSTSGNLLANLLMVQEWGVGQSYDPPAWSISTEWAAYLLFPLLVVPSVLRGRLSALIVLCASIATVTFLCYAPLFQSGRASADGLIDLHTYLGTGVIRCIAEFALGLVAFRFAEKKAGAGQSGLPASLACVVTIFFLLLRKGDLGFILAMPLLVVSLSSGESLPRRFLSLPAVEWLGLLSYSIYLIHDLMGGLLAWIHTHATALHIPHAQTAGAVVCFVLTFPVAWLAYTFIEVPGRRLLRDLFEKRTPATANIGTLRDGAL